MKPLSYFTDTDYSKAMAEEYGEYFEEIRDDCNWLNWFFAKTDESNLLRSLTQNIHLTCYSDSQRSLMVLSIDMYKLEGTFNKFQEILIEYMS